MPVRIIVTRGAISVLLFGNRATTHDIDFFHEDADVIWRILDSKDATPKNMKNWPGDWINSEMVAYVVNHKGCEGLYKNSIEQNTIIWKSNMRYQLVGKITKAYEYWKDRDGELSGTKRGTKDLDDAIFILHHMIQKEKGPLLLNEVRTWYHLGRFVEGEPLEYINSHFKARYGYEGIVTSRIEV